MRSSLPAFALFFALIGPSATFAEVLDELAIDAALSDAQELKGRIVRLQAEGEEFIAIHQPRQQGEPRGGIVLLHDQAGNANSLEVIRPLRLGLADAGWDTLSLQLPAGYRDADAGDWRDQQARINARLQAGLAWLKDNNIETQAVIAQGDTGIILLPSAATGAPPELQALVLVSTALADDIAAETLAPVAELTLPLLDIYAERDIAGVIDSATKRRQLLENSQSRSFRQITVAGATSGYFGSDGGLLASIRAWLAANTTRQPAQPQ